jgi:hypothetical protein
MTSSSDNYTSFFEALESSLLEGSFAKLILSKPRADLRWKKLVFAAFVDAQGERQISIEYFTTTQTERRNIPVEEAVSEIRDVFPEQMLAGHLKTTANEYCIEKTQRDSFRLKRISASSSSTTMPTHNRKKQYLLAADSPFLEKLGIASQRGEIRRDKYDKFRQIQKFIEIIADLVPESRRLGSTPLSVVDFGSGKHYLTFALHHFLSQGSAPVTVRGIEQRSDLVAFGEQTVQELSIKNLHFVQGSISQVSLDSADLVVALHACNTATDDALAKAVRAKASYICVAPCCHQYLRSRVTPSEDLRPMLRHGILAERFSESLTDSLRVLTLEALGYQTKLFEFVSPEHTAKNTMITASFTGRTRDTSRKAISDLRTKFGLADYYLDTVLADLLR